MKDFSYITSSHPAFIENLYQDFLQDPNSVDPDLKKFFEGFDFAVGQGKNGTNGTTAPAGTGAASQAATPLPSPRASGSPTENIH